MRANAANGTGSPEPERTINACHSHRSYFREAGTKRRARILGIPPPIWRQTISTWSIEAIMRNANAATATAVEAYGAGNGDLLVDEFVPATLRTNRPSAPADMSPNHLLTCAAPIEWLRADHSAPAPERAYDNTNANRCLAVRRDSGRRPTRK